MDFSVLQHLIHHTELFKKGGESELFHYLGITDIFVHIVIKAELTDWVAEESEEGPWQADSGGDDSVGALSLAGEHFYDKIL